MPPKVSKAPIRARGPDKAPRAPRGALATLPQEQLRAYRLQRRQAARAATRAATFATQQQSVLGKAYLQVLRLLAPVLINVPVDQRGKFGEPLTIGEVLLMAPDDAKTAWNQDKLLPAGISSGKSAATSGFKTVPSTLLNEAQDVLRKAYQVTMPGTYLIGPEFRAAMANPFRVAAENIAGLTNAVTNPFNGMFSLSPIGEGTGATASDVADDILKQAAVAKETFERTKTVSLEGIQRGRQQKIDDAVGEGRQAEARAQAAFNTITGYLQALQVNLMSLLEPRYQADQGLNDWTAERQRRGVALLNEISANPVQIKLRRVSTFLEDLAMATADAFPAWSSSAKEMADLAVNTAKQSMAIQSDSARKISEAERAATEAIGEISALEARDASMQRQMVGSGTTGRIGGATAEGGGSARGGSRELPDLALLSGPTPASNSGVQLDAGSASVDKSLQKAQVRAGEGSSIQYIPDGSTAADALRSGAGGQALPQRARGAPRGDVVSGTTSVTPSYGNSMLADSASMTAPSMGSQAETSTDGPGFINVSIFSRNTPVGRFDRAFRMGPRQFWGIQDWFTTNWTYALAAKNEAERKAIVTRMVQKLKELYVEIFPTRKDASLDEALQWIGGDYFSNIGKQPVAEWKDFNRYLQTQVLPDIPAEELQKDVEGIASDLTRAVTVATTKADEFVNRDRNKWRSELQAWMESDAPVLMRGDKNMGVETFGGSDSFSSLYKGLVREAAPFVLDYLDRLAGMQQTVDSLVRSGNYKEAVRTVEDFNSNVQSRAEAILTKISTTFTAKQKALSTRFMGLPGNVVSPSDAEAYTRANESHAIGFIGFARELIYQGLRVLEDLRAAYNGAIALNLSPSQVASAAAVVENPSIAATPAALPMAPTTAAAAASPVATSTPIAPMTMSEATLGTAPPTYESPQPPGYASSQTAPPPYASPMERPQTAPLEPRELSYSATPAGAQPIAQGDVPELGGLAKFASEQVLSSYQTLYDAVKAANMSFVPGTFTMIKEVKDMWDKAFNAVRGMQDARSIIRTAVTYFFNATTRLRLGLQELDFDSAERKVFEDQTAQMGRVGGQILDAYARLSLNDAVLLAEELKKGSTTAAMTPIAPARTAVPPPAPPRRTMQPTTATATPVAAAPVPATAPATPAAPTAARATARPISLNAASQLAAAFVSLITRGPVLRNAIAPFAEDLPPEAKQYVQSLNEKFPKDGSGLIGKLSAILPGALMPQIDGGKLMLAFKAMLYPAIRSIVQLPPKIAEEQAANYTEYVSPLLDALQTGIHRELFGPVTNRYFDIILRLSYFLKAENGDRALANLKKQIDAFLNGDVAAMQTGGSSFDNPYQGGSGSASEVMRLRKRVRDLEDAMSVDSIPARARLHLNAAIEAKQNGGALGDTLYKGLLLKAQEHGASPSIIQRVHAKLHAHGQHGTGLPKFSLMKHLMPPMYGSGMYDNVPRLDDEYSGGEATSIYPRPFGYDGSAQEYDEFVSRQIIPQACPQYCASVASQDMEGSGMTSCSCCKKKRPMHGSGMKGGAFDRPFHQTGRGFGIDDTDLDRMDYPPHRAPFTPEEAGYPANANVGYNDVLRPKDPEPGATIETAWTWDRDPFAKTGSYSTEWRRWVVENRRNMSFEDAKREYLRTFNEWNASRRFLGKDGSAKLRDDLLRMYHWFFEFPASYTTVTNKQLVILRNKLQGGAPEPQGYILPTAGSVDDEYFTPSASAAFEVTPEHFADYDAYYGTQQGRGIEDMADEMISNLNPADAAANMATGMADAIMDPEEAIKKYQWVGDFGSRVAEGLFGAPAEPTFDASGASESGWRDVLEDLIKKRRSTVYGRDAHLELSFMQRYGDQELSPSTPMPADFPQIAASWGVDRDLGGMQDFWREQLGRQIKFQQHWPGAYAQLRKLKAESAE